MEKTDRLLHDFAVNAVSEIRDGRKPHILNQRAAKIFRNSLEQEDKEQSQRKNRPDVMYPGRNQIVHVQDVVRAGNSKEYQFLKRGLRVQHYIYGGRDGKRHEAFGNSHGGHQNNTNSKQPGIGREIAE